MILEIAGLAASQFVITGLSFLAYHRWINQKTNTPIKDPNQKKAVTSKPPMLLNDNTVGLLVESMEEQEEIITTDEHLKRLIKLYPQAAKVYKNDHADKYLKTISDRYILRLLIAAEEGKMPAKMTAHQIEFGNGDKIWTSNKYYAYGNLSASPDNPQCCFESGSARVSFYTFMRIVHFEETHFDPVLQYNNTKIKVIL